MKDMEDLFLENFSCWYDMTYFKQTLQKYKPNNIGSFYAFIYMQRSLSDVKVNDCARKIARHNKRK